MRNIPRRKIIGMLAGGFAAFLAAPSTALAATPTIRNGDVCKKVGKKKTQDGKTFECVEEDGVRQWKRVKSEPEKKPAEPATSDVKVLDSAQLALGASLTAIVTSNAKSYAIVFTRTASGVVAFNRSCTHQGSLVVPRGSDQLYCPSHGSVFNASTGAVIEGPASRALTQYKATERGGSIYVTI
jgi:nitrite reductase/ring-hydroxylating ferredoxin subunit